jgi:hypothetical protein
VTVRFYPVPPLAGSVLRPAVRPRALIRCWMMTNARGTHTSAAARSRWARLLARIYEVSPLRTPDCGSDMRLLAFLTDPEVRRRHPPLPRPPSHRAATLPARTPPQAPLGLDTDPVAPVDRLARRSRFRVPSPDPRDRRWVRMCLGLTTRPHVSRA